MRRKRKIAHDVGTGPRYAQRPYDLVLAATAMAFVVLLSIFPIRNNDIWWHMAVGRELIQRGGFITTDPFTFTLPGAPWVPHSWLAGILFYLVYEAFSPLGLIVLRVLLVGATFALLFGMLKRLGVSLAFATPFVLLAVLNIHSRFILRPHLFEYLLIVLLLGYLVRNRGQRSVRFYAFPVLLQIVWVNVHASFYLGFVIVLLFYAGEWFSGVLSSRGAGVERLTEGPIEWRRVGMLILLMGIASFVNPDPLAFVFQPLQGDQRLLLTRYTLEWRSPFDPALAIAAFHPYYEMILGVTAGAFLLGVTRLKLTSLLLAGLFALLSFKAHRFRVEFALIAVPLALDQLRASAIARKLLNGLQARAGLALVFAVVASALLMYTARDRVMADGAVSDRYPRNAMAFIRNSDVAHRAFQPIGFGSYLLWDLYPARRSFIDGRNFNAGLYQDFIACQASRRGFRSVVEKYDLDAFLLPNPELSDAGMMNIHKYLVGSPSWPLVYMDHIAYLYVKEDRVRKAWLEENAYHLYNPLTFAKRRFSQAQVDTVISDLNRAVEDDSLYLQPLLDIGFVYEMVGDTARAVSAIRRAIPMVSNPEPLYERLLHMYVVQGSWADLIEITERLSVLNPEDYRPLFYYAWALMEEGRLDEALEKAMEARERNTRSADVHTLLGRIYYMKRNYVTARREVETALSIDSTNVQARSLRVLLDTSSE